MKKISDAVAEIVSEQPFLHFGLHHRLLNLTQVARFILPVVEARTHKEVRESAILMSLSRLQAELSPVEEVKDLSLDKINIHSGLCSFTVTKSAEMHNELNALFAEIRSQRGFITVTDGINEVTIIIDDDNHDMASDKISDKLRFVRRNIASVGVKFSDEVLLNPGVIYQLLQTLALQNINVIEVASTATEFNIYLEEKDVRLAFDSFYQRFSKKGRRDN